MTKMKKNVLPYQVPGFPEFTLPTDGENGYIRHCPDPSCPAHTRFFAPYWRLNEHMKTDHGWPRKTLQPDLDRRKNGRMRHPRSKHDPNDPSTFPVGPEPVPELDDLPSKSSEYRAAHPKKRSRKSINGPDFESDRDNTPTTSGQDHDVHVDKRARLTFTTERETKSELEPEPEHDLRREPQHLPYYQQPPYQHEPQPLPYPQEPQHVPYYQDHQHVSYHQGPQHVPYHQEPQHVPYQQEPAPTTIAEHLARLAVEPTVERAAPSVPHPEPVAEAIIDTATEAPIDPPMEQPSQQPTEQPVEQPVDKPAELPITQPVEQPIESVAKAAPKPRRQLKPKAPAKPRAKAKAPADRPWHITIGDPVQSKPPAKQQTPVQARFVSHSVRSDSPLSEPPRSAPPTPPPAENQPEDVYSYQDLPVREPSPEPPSQIEPPIDRRIINRSDPATINMPDTDMRTITSEFVQQLESSSKAASTQDPPYVLRQLKTLLETDQIRVNCVLSPAEASDIAMLYQKVSDHIKLKQGGLPDTSSFSSFVADKFPKIQKSKGKASAKASAKTNQAQSSASTPVKTGEKVASPSSSLKLKLNMGGGSAGLLN